MGTAMQALRARERLLDLGTAWLIAVALASIFVLPSQSASSFATYLLFFVLIASYVSTRSMPNLELQGMGGLAVLLITYLCVSSLWSSAPITRDVLSISIRACLVLTCIVAVAHSQQRVPAFTTWLVRGICAASTVAAVAALVDFYLHPTWDNRLWGLGQIDNSVTAALGFAAAAIVALSLADRSKGTEARLAWTIVGVLIVTISLTGSRSGYLALAMGATAMLLARSRAHTIGWIGTAAVAIILAGAVAVAVSPQLLVDVVLPRGTSFRPEIWAAQLAALGAAGIWFGRGILTDTAVDVAGLTFQHSHSIFLSVAVQGGLIGLSLFLALLLWGCARLWGSRATADARLGLALLVGGIGGHLFDGHELIDKVGMSWLYFWLPVGYALSVRNSSDVVLARKDP